MRWSVSMVGFLVLAAISAIAEEPAGAPLEGTKQELKALQRDEAAKKNETAGKLTGAGLAIQAPTAESVPFDYSKAQKKQLDQQSRKAADKNWLINGVNQLEKDSQAKARGTATAAEQQLAANEEGKDQPADASDPDYLLKVYNERKKEEADAKTDARHAAAARPDAMAPFLQGWLSSGSAAQSGKGADEFTRRPEGSSAPVAAGGSSPVTYTQTFSSPETSGAQSPAGVAAQPNPYLQGLDMPVASQSLDSGLRNQGSGGLSVMGTPADAPLAARSLDPLPAARAEEKKPLGPPQADDKKYFPQLKRF